MTLLKVTHPEILPFLALLDAADKVDSTVAEVKKKGKRKVSAYNKRYSAAYKRIRKKATLKNGSLRKGMTHKKIVKMAHAAAKRGGNR